jgi:hypothetical protein
MLRFQSPLENLIHYISINEFGKFVELFDYLNKDEAIRRHNLYVLHEEMSLYFVALTKNRKQFFDFLIERQYSEKNLPPEETAKLKTKYIELLLENLPKKPALFYEQITLLTKNNELLAFDINHDFKGITLLQHACFNTPWQLAKLIRFGCLANLDPSTDSDLNSLRIQSIKPLLDIKYDVDNLPPALMTSILIASARLNRLSEVECALRNGANVNACDAQGKAAIAYAVENSQDEMVEVLLNYSAASCLGLDAAISMQNCDMVEYLLDCGAGMFRDVPQSFLLLDANANQCCVQGMTIAGVPVTQQTHGFHAAFLSAEAFADYIKKRDRLDTTIPDDPIHITSIKHNIEYVASTTNEESRKLANLVINRCSSVRSLQRRICTDLSIQLLETSVTTGDSLTPLSAYLDNFPIEISQAIHGRLPEKQKALGIIYDRIDELKDFQIFAEKMFKKDKNLKKLLSKLTCAGINFSYTSVVAFGAYVGFAICCNQYTEDHWLSNLNCCCDHEVLTNNAMSFFGVPGYVLAGLNIVIFILTVIYLIKYGRGGVCCSSTGEDVLARNNDMIKTALDALVALMREENLSVEISNDLAAIEDAKITYSALLPMLQNIMSYYSDNVTIRIRDDKSQTPYANYNRNLFFHNPQASTNARNNRLPPRVVMDENPDSEMQYLLGHGLFEIVSDTDEYPEVIQMHDDLGDESIPLARYMN